MDCLDYLTQQHRQVDQLFEQIKAASEDDKYSLFEDVATALAVHAEIEEKIFYPAVKNKDTQALLKESYEEHSEVKQMIDDLLGVEPEEGSFDAKFSELVEAVQHHVTEEENELFPMVRQSMDDEKRDEIGNQLQERANEIESEEEPTEHIYGDTQGPSPL